METSFVGRAEQLAELARLVELVPVVTVTGPGGVGKSRLVREFVAGIGDGMRPIVGDLATVPAGATMATVAPELGFGSIDDLTDALADPATLLVVDNCEHVADAVSALLSGVGSEAVHGRAVVTSREPLSLGGGRLLVLDPLPVPTSVTDASESPAVRLFVERAVGAGAAWDLDDVVDDVVELCRRLDGLPLAIVLAAARCRAVTPGELLALIGRRPDVLDATGRRDVDARHASLRAAVAVSLEPLEDAERRVLDWLAVIAGTFDLEFAGAMASPDDPPAVVNALYELVDRSLVTADQHAGRSRYRVLNVIRDSLLDDLREAGELAPIAERYVDVAVSAATTLVVEGAQRWSPDVVERALALFHHLVATTGWALEHDTDATRANPLVVAMFAAVHRSRGRQVLDLGDRVVRRWPDASADFHVEVRAVLAMAAALVGDTTAAVAHGAAVVEVGDDPGLAVVIARRAMAVATRQEGRLTEALDHAAAGRRAAADLGLTSFEHDLAVSEAVLADQVGEHDRSVALLDDVIAMGAGGDDPIPQAGARLARATLAIRERDWGAARRDLVAAAEIGAAFDEAWWEGAVERTAAVLATCERGWYASGDAWRRAINAPGRRGNAGEMALALRLAASVALRFGHDDVARSLAAALPTRPEVALLPEPFPIDAAQIDEFGALGPRPSLPEALDRSLAALDHSATSTSTPSPMPVAERPDTDRRAGSTGVSTGVLRRDGDSWTVEFAGRSASVRNLRGIADIARLLAEPEREIHAVELMGGAHVGGSPDVTIDGQARRAYQARIVELQTDIDEARDMGNAIAAERAERELDALVEQLSEAFGLGGRPRPIGSSSERARSAVSYRIRRAIERIATVHDELGRHLDNAVRTGTWCTYRPEHPIAWEVAIELAPTPARQPTPGPDDSHVRAP